MTAQPESVRVTELSPHVLQIEMPTPTLPPAFVTNTYVVHDDGHALVVDMGSAQPEAIEAVEKALSERQVQTVEAVVATHYHRDHTEGLAVLADRLSTSAYVHARDVADAVRTLHLDADALCVLPDHFRVGHIDVRVEHWPGHTHGHVHLLVPADRAILVGDHLAGIGSVWIGPPDGHMADYYRALDAIANSGCVIAGPGHGPAIPDAPAAARALAARRQGREQEILTQTGAQWMHRDDLYAAIYGDTVAAGAAWVAKRTLLAHLQHLLTDGRVKRRYEPGTGFLYRAGAAAESEQSATEDS